MRYALKLHRRFRESGCGKRFPLDQLYRAPPQIVACSPACGAEAGRRDWQQCLARVRTEAEEPTHEAEPRLARARLGGLQSQRRSKPTVCLSAYPSCAMEPIGRWEYCKSGEGNS